MAVWDKNTIKKLRAQLGLSQSEFAHQLGCRQQTVSEWELGLYAPANAYGKLLDFLSRQEYLQPERKPSTPLAEAAAVWLSTPEVSKESWPGDGEEVREFDPAID